jgi:hypothetical protein
MKRNIRRNLTRIAAALTLSAVLPAAASALPIINEFVANHDGVDEMEFVEIFGLPNTDYSAYTIVEVEGEGAAAGLIDTFIQPAGITDANGFFVVPGPAGGLIENGTMSLLLVTGFTGAENNDIDANNDGVIDATFWTNIADAVGVKGPAAGDFTYGGTELAPNFDGGTLTVGGASRIPNAVDTGTALDWKRNNFNRNNSTPIFGQAANTPGALNSLQVPEPSGILLMVLAASAFIATGRRTAC